jgi:hypothetical protein
MRAQRQSDKPIVENSTYSRVSRTWINAAPFREEWLLESAHWERQPSPVTMSVILRSETETFAHKRRQILAPAYLPPFTAME